MAKGVFIFVFGLDFKGPFGFVGFWQPRATTTAPRVVVGREYDIVVVVV